MLGALEARRTWPPFPKVPVQKLEPLTPTHTRLRHLEHPAESEGCVGSGERVNEPRRGWGGDRGQEGPLCPLSCPSKPLGWPTCDLGRCSRGVGVRRASVPLRNLSRWI